MQTSEQTPSISLSEEEIEAILRSDEADATADLARMEIEAEMKPEKPYRKPRAVKAKYAEKYGFGNITGTHRHGTTET